MKGPPRDRKGATASGREKEERLHHLCRRQNEPRQPPSSTQQPCSSFLPSPQPPMQPREKQRENDSRHPSGSPLRPAGNFSTGLVTCPPIVSPLSSTPTPLRHSSPGFSIVRSFSRVSRRRLRCRRDFSTDEIRIVFRRLTRCLFDN